MTTPRQRAALALAALFLYYEVYRWIPLGRWNGQFHLPVDNDQFYPDIVIGALLLWFAWSFTRSSSPGIYTACVLLPLWVVANLFDWWIPYARDLPGNLSRYRFYQSHTQLLPAFGNHFPPDAGHTVLDALVFPTCAVVLLAASKFYRRQENLTA